MVLVSLRERRLSRYQAAVYRNWVYMVEFNEDVKANTSHSIFAATPKDGVN